MKIRTDFVTNSSSSSFILGFTSDSKDIIEKELKEGFPGWAMATFNIVLNDIMNEEHFDINKLEDIIREECEWSIPYRLCDKRRDKYGITFSEAYAWRESDECKKESENETNKFVNAIKEKCKDLKSFVEISYSDNDGDTYSELEHNIMNCVESMIISFSHH